MELKFEPEAVRALGIMQNSNKCLYLTGKAWSWKSTLINYFISKTKKKHALLWTTGVSAEMIWWDTIHKFFKLRPWKKWIASSLDNDTKEFIKDMDMFIIDEISMMRADLFDFLNKLMQSVMENDLFFWWKQFIFVWDLFQLPPVPERKDTIELEKYNKKYKWLFFFDWNSYLKEHFEIVQLKKVYRQTDMAFVDMLNRVRSWDWTSEVINYFNKKYINKEDIHEKAILIATTNKIAFNYNNEKLDKLPWDKKMSKAFITWDYPEDIYPTDLWVVFKKWARVMFTVNEKEWYYKNWTLWVIKEIYKNSVYIEKDDWKSVEVSRKQWVNSDWDDNLWNPIILWTFTQYPFKLAFAITSHKCQWKSFDEVIVDFWRGCFSSWQAYVALSRCRSYEWLQLLTKIKKDDIFVDKTVVNFLK